MVTLKEIADFLSGSLDGDGDYTIRSVNSLFSAKDDEITYSRKDQIDINRVSAGAVVISRSSTIHYKNVIYVDDPTIAFAALLEYFFPHQPFCSGLDERAFIAPSARLAENVSVAGFSHVSDRVNIGRNTEIHANVTIYPDVIIGNDCLIYSNVVVREGVEIGDRVIIQPGAVIGSDGFGFTRTAGNRPVKIPQKGKVIIGDDCEIGANTCIDRSTLEATVLQSDIKLDNLVQIGHNVTVGARTALSAQTGISGSTEIGSDVLMGGQVGLNDHIKIGNRVMAVGKTGITRDVKDDTIVAGYPHQEVNSWRRSVAITRNLETYMKRLKALEKKILKLEETCEK